MQSIQYKKVGRHDFFEQVSIDPEGDFSVEKFSYSDQCSRSGKLCNGRLGELNALLDRLPTNFNNVSDDRSFASQVLVDSGIKQREFWLRPDTDASNDVAKLVSFIRDL